METEKTQGEMIDKRRIEELERAFQEEFDARTKAESDVEHMSNVRFAERTAYYRRGKNAGAGAVMLIGFAFAFLWLAWTYVRDAMRAWRSTY